MVNQSKFAKLDDGCKGAIVAGLQGVGTSHGSHGAAQNSQLVFGEKFQTIEEIINTLGFVDKTLFIKAFFEAQPIVLITAPRRFGKSTNMDTLKQFLLGNCQLFQKNQCKIFTEDENWFNINCRKHPVIYVDFKQLARSNYNAFEDAFRELLCESFRDHSYLVQKVGDKYVWASEQLKEKDESVEKFLRYYDQEKSRYLTENDIIQGLKYLSEILHIHHGEKVFILIDEYDAPVTEGLTNRKISRDDVEEMFNLVQFVMGEMFKNNYHLERALINACVRLAGALSGHAVGVIHNYPFLTEVEFEEFYGFTTDDVDLLLEKSEFKKLVEGKRQKIDEWYGGYETVSGTAIYNGWSILNVLHKELQQEKKMKTQRRKQKRRSFCQSFWIDTGYVKNMEALFTIPDIREKIEALVGDDEVQIKKIKSVKIDQILKLKDMMELEVNNPSTAQRDLFLQFLSDTGYLNSLPNEEAHEELEAEEEELEAGKIQEPEGESEAQEKEKDLVQAVYKPSIVKIPNLEMKAELIDKCYSTDFLQEEYQLKPKNITAYQRALIKLMGKPSEECFSALASSVTQLFSGGAKVPDNEDALHCILFTCAFNIRKLNVGTEVRVKRARKKQGRPPRIDILLICGKKGIIIELKVNPKNPEDALVQIFKVQYDRIFQEDGYGNVTEKSYAGLSFYNEGQKTSICYTIDSKDKNNAKTVSSKLNN